MRHVIVAAALLACSACQKHETLDIATAKTRAALALSAFECSHLAVAQADASRLFNLGLTGGREFLDFAESNPSGYQSIISQIDPIWISVASRPTADFKLGEIHAATIGRLYAYRDRLNDSAWENRRAELYTAHNCAFLGSAHPAK